MWGGPSTPHACVTIETPASTSRTGRRTVLDRDSHMSAEELAHQQERFDIHVMAFGDRSPAAAEALQRAFALDEHTATRLLSETPVVVKRAAPPDVANELLDVLIRLGAQVVLLPSAARAAEPARESPADAARPVTSNASAWGGLDLQLPPHARATVRPGVIGCDAEQSSPASLPPPSSVFDSELDSESERDGLEFDLGADDPQTEPPLPDLALGEVPPLPALQSLGAAPPLPPPPAMRASQRPVAPRSPLMQAAPPQPPAMRAVPALPPPPVRMSQAAPSLPRLSPPPVRSAAIARTALPSLAPPSSRSRAQPSAASVRAAAAAGKGQHGNSRGPRMLDPGSAMSLPKIDVAARERRGEHRDPRLEPPEMLAPPTARLSPPVPLTPAPELPPRKPVPAPRPPVSARSRAIAVLELGAALVVLYLGLRMDDSVLHGNASLLSVAVHGLAFYGLGAGLAGLRP